MSPSTHCSRWLAMLVASWLLSPTHLHGETLSRLSTRFLARGEQALLEIAVANGQPTAIPEIPPLADVEIRPTGRGTQTRLLPGRRPEYIFEYLVSSYVSGRHVLPAIEVQAGGLKTRTEPLEFTVFNPDELQWSEALVGNTPIRYASAFRVMNERPYVGETIPIEIKLFVPRELFVEDWGIPDFERDGLTSWRFQPSAMRGQVNLLGKACFSVAYPSTLTPTRTGTVGIGPATLRLITTDVVLDGVLRRIAREVNLTIPRLDLEAQPLPPGAPAGFENAVGEFQLSVGTALTEAQQGDPIPLDIVVTGSGNLETMRPPNPVDASGWKLYDATAEQRGDERRDFSGSRVFHQFMRPLEFKAEIPPFRLVYFDPKEGRYITRLTDPLPIKIIPAKGAKPDTLNPPAASAVPVERMADILGISRGAPATMASTRALPAWLGHAVGAALALGLLLRALWLRCGPRLLRQDPLRTARNRELHQLAGLPRDDDPAFLLAAGRFIERWLGNHTSPELRAILSERDAVCFRQDKPAATILPPRRRNSILTLLRKSCMLWLALLLLGQATAPARAADLAAEATAAYDDANYDQAIRLWLQAGPYQDLTAETLYNIGNACYRAGSPGYAALYYRRALVRNPATPESRQNLRFIERKHGAITVRRPEYQYALSRIPLEWWRGLLWTGLWCCALAVLIVPATRPGARVRVLAIAAVAVGPLLAATGALGWYYFPDDAQFAPLARQAVIVSEKAVAHSEAARTSPEVIDAPPGSLCEVLVESGRWAYVAFASKTRGWIPSDAIEKVVPATPPTPPVIRPPKADGKTA